jgi:hypothetical protein
MADNSSTYTKTTDDLPTQPIRISGDTRPIRLKSTAPAKPTAGREKSRLWLLGGLFAGVTVLIALVGLALVVYNFRGFSTLAVGSQPPAAVLVATPVDGSKPGSAVQPLAAGNSGPTPTQVNTTATGTAVPTILNAPVTVLSFNQTQLDAINIQLSDLVLLSPHTTWGEVSTYHDLTGWAKAGTAQALSAAGEQHMSGTGFRSQGASTGTALVTSTVHEFAGSDGAQKGVEIMAGDAKTSLSNNLVMQSTATLRNGAKMSVTLVTGGLRTGTYAVFIASYQNMVVNVAVGGFDSSSTGLDALVKDSRTLGQQMLNQIADAAPLR